MEGLILFDSGPLGLATKPWGKPDRDACRAWLDLMVAAGYAVAVPEIADYEVRREFERLDATAAIRRLDVFEAGVVSLPLSTAVMRRAAKLWGDLRKLGRQTADDTSLDADCIVAAFAQVEAEAGDRVIVATDNVRHLARFPGIDARGWRDIKPAGR